MIFGTGTTCIERKAIAAKILDNWESPPEEVQDAKQVLRENFCHDCANPLIHLLGLDDLLCSNKQK